MVIGLCDAAEIYMHVFHKRLEVIYKFVIELKPRISFCHFLKSSCYLVKTTTPSTYLDRPGPTWIFHCLLFVTAM